ncbi:MAG: copper chaperone CopZ [Spirosomataceae bacterium]|jgi:copper chaperone CopZ
MENTILTTYHVAGMSSEDCTTTIKNKLAAVAGVISVEIDPAKKEAQITSNEDIEMNALEQALVDTDYYIARQTENSWVSAPSFRKVASRTKQKHNASRDVEGSGSRSANTGPVTDYDGD